MLGKGLQLKITAMLVFFLWLVKSFKQYSLFSDFQYGFRSSQSTVDLLTVRSGATQALALVISKVFDRVWYADLLHKLKSYGISGLISGFSLLEGEWGESPSLPLAENLLIPSHLEKSPQQTLPTKFLFPPPKVDSPH